MINSECRLHQHWTVGVTSHHLNIKKLIFELTFLSKINFFVFSIALDTIKITHNFLSQK